MDPAQLTAIRTVVSALVLGLAAGWRWMQQPKPRPGPGSSLCLDSIDLFQPLPSIIEPANSQAPTGGPAATLQNGLVHGSTRSLGCGVQTPPPQDQSGGAFLGPPPPPGPPRGLQLLRWTSDSVVVAGLELGEG